MENDYIGRPKDFHYMEGSEALNFRKTFDLNGTQNDEMLRLYLRKAGLSDEIEYLTAEQRRAFIYDIIQSNKMPGYWLPSTMQNSNYNQQRQKVQPPPPPAYSTSSSPYVERRNMPDSPMINYTPMRSSVSTGNLQNFNKSSPVLPQRFIPAPATPPLPTTFVTSSKGVQYEISGPMDFRHTAGDMTRDMTRNAFDLTPSSNDNVLRKYMMERGISEEDIAGMRKTDLIRKIVQSKFTWLPKKKNNSAANKTSTIEQRINYATISGYPDNTISTTLLRSAPNPKPQTPPATSPTSKTDFSNFTLVTSRFADPNRFSSVNDLYGTNAKSTSNNGVIDLPPLPAGTQMPAPPPRKSQYSSASLPTIKRNAPPPPLVIAAQANAFNMVYETRELGDYGNNYRAYPIDLTPKNAFEPTYAIIQDNPKSRSSRCPPPTPPKRNIPPLPPMGKMKLISSSPPMANMTSIPPPPPMANIPPPPPMANIPPPPPMANIPPPPPMIGLQNGSHIATSRNPISVKTDGGVPPPPAPPINQTTMNNNNPITTTDTSEDSRDAFLESIRKGVTLKKIDQKAATISGVKTRAERRPQVTDFLTELKMGLTSRRMKNPEDNPFKGDKTNEWND